MGGGVIIERSFMNIGLLSHPNDNYSLLNVMNWKLVPIVIQPGAFVPTKFTRLCLVLNLRPLERGASNSTTMPPSFKLIDNAFVSTREI